MASVRGSEIKSYQPVDYAAIALAAFAITFLYASIIHMVPTDIDPKLFAAKYYFEAEQIASAAHNVKWTAFYVFLGGIGLTTTLLFLCFFVGSKKKWTRNALLWNDEMGKYRWEKPWVPIATAVAAAGIAIIVSTLLVQLSSGMYDLNHYYAGCQDSGFKMSMVDMRKVYESMDRLDTWNQYFNGSLITGIALSTLGLIASYMLTKSKKKQPEAIQLQQFV